MKWVSLLRRQTIWVELCCIFGGARGACLFDTSTLQFALLAGIAASAFVALLLDIQSAFSLYNQEKQTIRGLDKMISPIIRRWVELYIYISDKDLVKSSNLANEVNNAKRCGVDLMPECFNLDDMVNMFAHPFLVQQPLNVPVITLFADIEKKFDDTVSRFLIARSLTNFKAIYDTLSGIIEVMRKYDTVQHIVNDETLTLSGKTFWDQFKTLAGSLVEQFPPKGNGNPIWNHYFWFMVRLQSMRKLLISYEDRMDSLR